MNPIFTVTIALSLTLEFAAADLQSIHNAHPLNIDLSDPSETGLASNGDREVDEHKFGGYRPLYPPYFLRESTGPSQQQQHINGQPEQPTYYDKEYYTRGTRHDDRLDRTLRIASRAPPPALAHLQQVNRAAPIALERPIDQYARAFPDYHVKSEYTKAGSLHVKSTYSFSSIRFPNT